ncbi:MAG: hypothetical protein JNG88_14695 [Phycisphaerales bacterium]|nr:hypothetical protein [Phycisphaerales bacterium]
MARNRFLTCGITLTAAAVSITNAGGESIYDFTLNAPPSGFEADIGLSISTAGTLIGDWIADTNPTGTRTKPGLIGPFGSDENLPVDVALSTGLGGSPSSQSSGGFRMTFNPALGVVTMSNYSVNLLASGPSALPITITLETDAFRTRNPTALWLGGVPITIPIGEAELSTLQTTQVGDAIGLLTPIDGTRFSFSIPLLATLDASVSVLGNAFEIPGVPTPLLFEGEVELLGDNAHLTSVRELVIDETQDPQQTLPQFPLDVPTYLPPGETAHFLMDLTLGEIGLSVDGTLTTDATGIRIPEPASVLLIATFALLRRRAA